MSLRPLRCLALLGFLALGACGDGDGAGGANDGGATSGGGGSGNEGAAGGGSPQDADDPFDPAVATIEIEIDYEAGAEPYTGTVAVFGDLWSMFETNADALFDGSSKQIFVPTELAEMEELGDFPDESFTGDRVLEIAAEHRDAQGAPDRVTYYVLFVDGFYEDDGQVKENVLGVSLGNTRVIAMFKPVIESTSGGPLLDVEKYVEQATLIHEFGHAVGLVNNGLAPTSEHEDAEHGAHCTNEDCVMYWQLEGTSGAVQFVTEALGSEDPVLFGPECLADAAAARDQ